MFGRLERPGDAGDAARSPVFRGGEGELWLDPGLVDPDADLTLEVFRCFEHCGAVYELWGRRSDGLWWIGRMSASDVPPGAHVPPLRAALGSLTA
jgi:hypothetical protein